MNPARCAPAAPAMHKASRSPLLKVPTVRPGAAVGSSSVEALREVGYDGYLTMETGFHSRGIEPDYDARQAYEFLKPLAEGE